MAERDWAGFSFGGASEVSYPGHEGDKEDDKSKKSPFDVHDGFRFPVSKSSRPSAEWCR